jgi:valyl-tRNA synthetase
MVDLNAERERLQKELARIEEGVARSQKLLSNQGFVTQAPAEVVQKERDKLTSLQEQAEKLRGRLATLAV